jgi:hypothetical protein
MPEKIAGYIEQVANALLFSLVGISIGIGQLLASGEVLTARIVVGRALSTGGIAMAAGAVLVWVPDVPMLGLFGVAAGLASLGTSGLERLFKRLISGRGV